MSEEMQIEEMAKVICVNNRDCKTCAHNCGIRECGCIFYAKRLYEQGYRKQSEWISVDERLPEPNEECLVSARVGDRVVIDLGEIVRYCDGRIFGWMTTNDWDEGEGCKITHWMPLPEPPDMKGGAE